MVAPAKIAISVKTTCMFWAKMTYSACGDGDELGVSFNRSSLSFETAFMSFHGPVHEISNNVVCATSKGSDQPAHTRSLIRAFASRLSKLWLLTY